MKISALLAGLIFGLGLILSGMTNPARIIAFLDVTGAWNGSLALVMGGAVLAALPAFAWARRHPASRGGALLRGIDRSRIDARLLLGAAIFGLGWGLSGLCPGPGLVLAASGHGGAMIFVAAMAVGMLITRRLLRARGPAAEPLPQPVNTGH